MESAFVVQKSLFNLEAFAVLSKRFQARRLTADNLPLFLSVRRSGDRNMDWAKYLAGDSNVMETAGFPGLESNFVKLAQALTLQVSEDQVRLDSNAIVPAAGPEPIHQLGIAKTPVGEKTDIMDAEHIEDPFNAGQQGEELPRRNLGTLVFDDFLMEWKSAPTEEDSEANQAELAEEHAGVQGEHQTVLAPMSERLEDKRRIGLEGINLRVLQKPTALNLSALRELRF